MYCSPQLQSNTSLCCCYTRSLLLVAWLFSPLYIANPNPKCKCVCTQNWHMQSWLCKWETKKVAMTKACNIPAHQQCCFRSIEERGVIDWTLSSNMNNLSPGLRTAPLITSDFVAFPLSTLKEEGRVEASSIRPLHLVQTVISVYTTHICPLFVAVSSSIIR